MSYGNDRSDVARGVLGIGGLIIAACALIFGCIWAYGSIRVWTSEQAGRAEYAQAEANRRIKVLEASAAKEAAVALADAEVSRARGVAEANKIIGDSLKGNDSYLRYLWITSLERGEDKTVVYVPTEANLPIMEATRLERK